MRTLIFVFCLFCSLSVMAQGDWYVGVSATPFSYWLHNEDALSSDRLTYENDLFEVRGVQTEVQIGKEISEVFSVESGVGYSHQTQYFTGGAAFYFSQMQYIHLPVRVKCTLAPGSTFQPYIKGGLQGRWLLDYYSRYDFKSDATNIIQNIVKVDQTSVESQRWTNSGDEYLKREFQSNGALYKATWGGHIGVGLEAHGYLMDWYIGVLFNWDWREVFNDKYLLDNIATYEDEAIMASVLNDWPDTDARTTHVWVGLEVGVRYYW
jgi:hypothetical protein